MSVAVPGTCVHVSGAVGLMQNVQPQFAGSFAEAAVKIEAARYPVTPPPNPLPLSKQNVQKPKALEPGPNTTLY